MTTDEAFEMAATVAENTLAKERQGIMTENNSGAMLMWMAGVVVGVGAAKENGWMMVEGGALTLAAMFYFRRFCNS